MSNVTDFTNATGVHEIIIGLNDATTGWLAGLILLFAFFIFVSMNYTNTRDFGASITTGGFISFIFAVLLWAADLLALYIVVIPLVVFLIGIGVRLIGRK